jgi:hypothetical protein
LDIRTPDFSAFEAQNFHQESLGFSGLWPWFEGHIIDSAGFEAFRLCLGHAEAAFLVLKLEDGLSWNFPASTVM